MSQRESFGVAAFWFATFDANLQCHGAATARRTPDRARLPRARTDCVAVRCRRGRGCRVRCCRDTPGAAAPIARDRPGGAPGTQSATDSHRERIESPDFVARLGGGGVLRGGGAPSAPRCHRASRRPRRRRASNTQPASQRLAMGIHGGARRARGGRTAGRGRRGADRCRHRRRAVRRLNSLELASCHRRRGCRLRGGRARPDRVGVHVWCRGAAAGRHLSRLPVRSVARRRTHTPARA
jgi:hypothetical protein